MDRAGVVAATVSADAQEHQTRQWKARAIRDAGEPFLAFYLSYDGYVQLGIEDSLIPTDPYFRAGMKSTPAGSRNIVTDPSPPNSGTTASSSASRLAQRWPVDGQADAQVFRMANFVTMRAGEYFFAPSLSFLAAL